MSKPFRHLRAANDDRSHAALAVDLSKGVRRVLADALLDLGDPDRAPGAPLTVERARIASGPAQLASAHPGDDRARQAAQALYERCLARYRALVGATDAEHDDVGAALAHFVAANLEALDGEPAAPAALQRLERQLAQVVRLSRAWSRAPAGDRRSYVEQLQILAVLIGDSLVPAAIQGPAATAHLQRAARGYLRQLLGLDPAELALGDGGLTLRPQPAVGAGATAQPA